MDPEETPGEAVAEPVVEPVEGGADLDTAPDPEDGQSGAGDDAPAAEAAPEGDPEPEPDAKPKRNDWREARIAEMARKNGDLQRRLDAALSVTGAETRSGADDAPKTYTEEEVDRRARTRAEEIAHQAVLTKACNDLFAKGVETHKDGFVEARDSLVNAFGDTLEARPDFLEALTELPNGHEVFFALAKDLDHAAEVLSLPSAKMGLRLAQLSADVGKTKPRQLSNAPAPITPVRGAAHAQLDIDDPDLPIEEFMKRRNKADTLRFN